MSRAELARLVREYLLCGHLIDRAGAPLLIGPYGRDVMRDVAIEEWRGASPIYTRRIQQLLGFGRGDVETIFKGMQIDIGAPPQFMDFRYRVHDAGRGEFWLDHCGALMDVEPMGDDYVTAMCHDIEDPTFDATAWATDPRARMTPIHRPPRRPADRHPHCAWNVVIDPAAEALPEPDEVGRMARTRVARLPVATIDADDDEGRSDYTGPLQADVRFEDFSASTLCALLDEVAVQHHLLAQSFLDAVARRSGADDVRDLGRRHLIGIGAVTAGRLARLLDVEGGGAAAVARVLEVHPAFRPRSYVDVEVQLEGDRVLVSLGECEALREERVPSWPQLLAGGPEPLAAMAQGVDRRARVAAGGDRSWEVVVDPAVAPADEPKEVVLTRFSTGADFAFADR